MAAFIICSIHHLINSASNNLLVHIGLCEAAAIGSNSADTLMISAAKLIAKLNRASVQFWIAFHTSHASPVLPLKLLSSLSMYTLKFDVSPHVITAVEWLSTLRGMTALIKSRDSYQVIAESVYRLCFPLVSIGNKHIAKKAAKINPPAA
jgi:hypothetical protein